MIKNKHRERLQKLLDRFIFENSEPNQSGSFWSYDDKNVIRYRDIQLDGKKGISEIDISENPIEFNYVMFLTECIMYFKEEIESNVNSLLKQDKTEYLEPIVKCLEERIKRLKDTLVVIKEAQKQSKTVRVLFDKDKIYPIQLRYLTDLLNFLRDKYKAHLKSTNTQPTFNCNLVESHYNSILSLINSINLFSKDISLIELKAIFNCNISEPFIVNNNQKLAYLFNCLAPKFITSEWQSIIEKNKLFKGKRGSFIKAKNLSKSLNEADPQSEISKQIYSLIKQMK